MSTMSLEDQLLFTRTKMILAEVIMRNQRRLVTLVLVKHVVLLEFQVLLRSKNSEIENCNKICYPILYFHNFIKFIIHIFLKELLTY